MINRILLDKVYSAAEHAFMKHFPDYRQSNFVNGEGSDEPDPAVMVIGEAPGAQEDVKGRPFCGESGIILRMMMVHAGLNTGHGSLRAGNTWLTNVVKLRPPRNRTPTAEEIELGRGYLTREWEAINKPAVIVCVGNTALSAVTGTAGITKRAGRCEDYKGSDGRWMYVWPMIHPSAAIRNKPLQPILESHWNLFSMWFEEYPF